MWWNMDGFLITNPHTASDSNWLALLPPSEEVPAASVLVSAWPLASCHGAATWIRMHVHRQIGDVICCCFDMLALRWAGKPKPCQGIKEKTIDGNKEIDLKFPWCMIHSFWSILSLSFILLCSFPPLFLLCGTPIGQTTCCSWWRFTDGECDWIVRLLTSACRKCWTLAWRGDEDTQYTKRNYTHPGDTRANKPWNTFFSPSLHIVPLLPILWTDIK